MTSSHYDYTSAVISKSKNGFQNGSWGNPYDYIVIGMQQWGYLAHSGNTTGQTVNFNITFPTACYSVVASRTDSGATSYWTFVIHTNSVTTTKFQCHLANNLYWIALGKQQWGESLGTSSPTTVTLPIAYTSTLFAAYATPSTTGFWQAPACVERTYTLSTIKVGAYGGSASLYLKWLTVGV